MQSRTTDNNVTQLVFTALMICLILLGTILFRIPVPMTQGYVHLGDTMIYLGILLLGRREGAAAAALGSALGDILGGFAFWAPWTLAIKFTMAFVTGTIISGAPPEARHAADASRPRVTLRTAMAMAAGGLVMCAGYLAAERVMYGSWSVAALGVPWNILQFTVGIAVSAAVYPLLAKHIGSK